MAKLKSIFGAYADSMQLMIDRSQDRFAPTWFPSVFGWAPPQVSLTYTSILGASRIEAAASVVSRNSSTPLRARGELSKLSGAIPAIKEMFNMTEDDYRDFLTMQSMQVSDTVRRDQMLDLIFNDVLKVGNAAMKRIDYMVLEGLSTGKVSLTTLNNPDGVILTQALDLLMPPGNIKQSAVTWDTAASATPITDIQTVKKAAQDAGRSIDRILMSDVLWMKFIKTKEVIDTMLSFLYGPKAGSGLNPVAVTTLDRVNEFLSANRLPVIEIIDQVVGIEKDGIITPMRPFNEDNAVFVPSGPLGTIKNAIAIEQVKPVAGVSYASYQRALISKWSANEPYGEWTKSELNAFPSFDTIDGIFLLNAVHD
ncbi:Phage major capsid protein E [Chitinophaga sp. YR573]|uniref:major capsid protein n=1 Tax=Chitinophaga sp. YR573 TaxID=1881040 RepID=UPI0008BEAEFC|nr:major capsid protein [Chitinophaga sp. YR573]SEV88873.1 Phage major capsid protein E [Chitinophaga sp. YR573]